MRDFGKISWRLWDSKKFRRCSESAQLTYLNLHTNKSCTSAGLVSATPHSIAVDRQVRGVRKTPEEIADDLAELHALGLVIWDEDEELVLITQFLDQRFNPVANGKHARGILRALKHVGNQQIILAVVAQLAPYYDKMFDDDVEDVKATISRIRKQKPQQNQRSDDTGIHTGIAGYRTETQTQTQTEIPLTPKGLEKGERQTPRKTGTNARAKGTNPRSPRLPAQPLPDIPPQFAAGWSNVLAAAGRALDEPEVTTWLAPLVPSGIVGDALQVRAPSGYVRDWVKTHYGGQLNRWCKVPFGTDRVEVVA